MTKKDKKTDDFKPKKIFPSADDKSYTFNSTFNKIWLELEK